MPETFALSESAVAVLRFRVKGYRLQVTDRSLDAFRELAAARIMELSPLKNSLSVASRSARRRWRPSQELQ
jgi:hypothetical protein